MKRAALSQEDVKLAFVKMGPGAIDFLIAKLKLDNRPKPLPPERLYVTTGRTERPFQVKPSSG